MSETAMKAAQLLDMLPGPEQDFALEIIQRLIKAWDPDFTKVTEEEAKRIEQAEKSGWVDDSEIDWSKIGV